MFIYFYYLYIFIYGITSPTSCTIYYYRARITIVSITASFILPLTRSLSDDPGFACPDWRSEIPFAESALESHGNFLIGTIHRYLGHLFLLSYLSLLLFISVMIADLFLQVFLYLFHAGTHDYMEVMYCNEA